MMDFYNIDRDTDGTWFITGHRVLSQAFYGDNDSIDEVESVIIEGGFASFDEAETYMYGLGM